MLTYLKFMLGMAILGLMFGWVLPMLISAENDFAVIAGGFAGVICIPIFVYLFWKDELSSFCSTIFPKTDNNDKEDSDA